MKYSIVLVKDGRRETVMECKSEAEANMELPTFQTYAAEGEQYVIEKTK